MQPSIFRMLLATFLICVLALNIAVAGEVDAAGLELFEKKVRPALVKYCFECHSVEGKKIKGKLRVDSRDALQRGGESGPSFIPGSPEKSLFIEAVVYKNQDLQMPPDGKLPDDVIKDLTDWVKRGAPWTPALNAPTHALPDEKRPDYDKLLREHWAFKPLAEAAPPTTKDAAWAKSPIDQFILARLEESKLTPNKPADKLTLLRRVTFDLTGLPPTLAEIDSFTKDSTPDAIDRVVDRLLASPRFGERWGRHWLDVARYAESAGGGRIVALNNAWRYREYVIDAFNRDMPYNRFVTEQIAGDLLPAETLQQHAEQTIATGFLAIGPKNLDTQDKDLLRMDVVDEQIDTVGKTLLGMTFGCARCHDHKFDPFTTKEYYALAGIFRSTKTLTPGNVSGVVQSGLPTDPEMQKKIEEHDRLVSAMEQKLNDLRTESKKTAQAAKAVAPAAPSTTPVIAKTQTPPPNIARIDPKTLPGIVIDDGEANIVGTWIKSTHTKPYVGEGYLHDNNKSKGELSVTFSPTFPKTGVYEVRLAFSAYNSRPNNVPVVIQHADGEKTVIVNQQVKETLIDGIWISLGRFTFNQGNDGSVTISNTGTAGNVTIDAVQFLTPEEAALTENPAQTLLSPAPALPVAGPAAKPPANPSNPADTKLGADEEKALLDRLEKEITALKKKAPVAPQALAVREEEQVGDYNICIRGDVHRLGDVAPRSFPRVAAFETKSVPPKQSGRVELAAWLTDPRNVLTSRVMVNRIWHHLFGAGLVRSTDNFGITGEQPSHPALLDYLARQFVDGGWSVKKSIRAIVLSRTYQSDCARSPDAARVDPENRLLWRANRRRLDAEAIRDSILANSGDLELLDTRAPLTRMRPDPKTEKNTRSQRTVYLSIERETLDPMLEAFDFADPNLVVGTRSRSNLPTQALFLMNSPFAVEQSQKAAARLLAQPIPDDTQRLQQAYLTVLGRVPSVAEIELSTKFLKTQDGKPQVAWARLYQSLFACVDFRFLD